MSAARTLAEKRVLAAILVLGGGVSAERVAVIAQMPEVQTRATLESLRGKGVICGAAENRWRLCRRTASAMMQQQRLSPRKSVKRGLCAGSPLTTRQRDALLGIVEQLSVQQIARRLGATREGLSVTCSTLRKAGMATWTPRRGWRVTPKGLHELRRWQSLRAADTRIRRIAERIQGVAA